MCCFQRLSVSIGLFLFITSWAVAGPSQEQLSASSSGFVVASVKPTGDLGGRALLQATPGQLAMTNLALRRLILIAYDVQDDQLIGSPSWIDSAHYDIQAKADGNPSVQQMEGPMLRSLLQERFSLMLHRETRQLPVYRLSLSKRGARLQSSKESSCTPYITDSPPPTASEESRPNYCGIHVTVNGLNRTLDGKGVTMAALAANLSRAYTAALGRDVVDGTGLTGKFDIHLEWAMDIPAAIPNDTESSASSDSPVLSIFTALQEQLGLRLESIKEPVEVLVIDHIEKPSGN